MKRRNTVVRFTSVFTLLTMLSVPVASADTGANETFHPYPRMVALGDSITFGYNLDPNNLHVSREAYPFLIGKYEKYQVRDISEPGWTSEDLLTDIEANRYVQESVKHADVITIDIGSNDILGPAVRDGLLSSSNLKPTFTASEKEQFAAAIRQFGVNLVKILQLIKVDAPRADVVVYNIYNPIPAVATQLHALGETLIGQENSIISEAAAAAHVSVADAYGAFDGQQMTYVRMGDVHPTLAGQEALAVAGEAALKKDGAPTGN